MSLCGSQSHSSMKYRHSTIILFPPPSLEGCFCLWETYAGVLAHRVLSSLPCVQRAARVLHPPLPTPGGICSGQDKRRMRKKAWRGLVLLLLCMSDQTQSVAQVRGSKLGSGDPSGVVSVLWARVAGLHLPYLAQQPVPRPEGTKRLPRFPCRAFRPCPCPPGLCPGVPEVFWPGYVPDPEGRMSPGLGPGPEAVPAVGCPPESLGLQPGQEGGISDPFSSPGAMSHCLLLGRSPGKPSLSWLGSCRGKSSSRQSQHSTHGSSQSAW